MSNNKNDKWKEFDEFKSLAEFRGFTRAKLENIESTQDKILDRFDNVYNKIDENDNCIARNSVSIGELRVSVKNTDGNIKKIEKNAEKKGGIMGTISGGITSLVLGLIQMVLK